MKKKLLIGLLAIIALFTISGCGNKCKGDDCNTEKPVVNIDPEALIGDKAFVFDTDGQLSELKFKYPSNANVSNLGTYAIIDSMENDKLVYRIAMYYFDNKKEYEVMNDSSLERVSQVKTKNLTWNIYEGIEDDARITTYVYSNTYDTYTISFLSDYDIAEFIDVFLGTITF